MDLTLIDTLPEPARIISLCDARTKYQAGKCKHLRMVVDEQLDTVECEDCKEKLNAVAMLLRFATEESLWQRRAEELKKLHVALDAKVRCKCRHCGQMTRVRP
jgi:hypothetical protein